MFCRYKKSSLTLMTFSLTSAGARQQINEVTAYLDASYIYGSVVEVFCSLKHVNGQHCSSTKRLSDLLRGPNGKMRENDLFRSRKGLAYMPYDEGGEIMDCSRCVFDTRMY